MCNNETILYIVFWFSLFEVLDGSIALIAMTAKRSHGQILLSTCYMWQQINTHCKYYAEEITNV